MTGNSERMEQLPPTAWHKEAELEAPGSSSLRPPNDSNRARNATTDSEVSSVVNDLGDAKQLAQTRSFRKQSSGPKSAANTSQLVSHVGTKFAVPSNRVENIDSDLSQTEALEGESLDGVVRVDTSQKLWRTIRKALHTSSWERDKEFLPIDKLDIIINEEGIRGELRLRKQDADMAKKIWGTEGSKISELTTRRKIFAILVLIGQVPAINDFIKAGIYDNSLPFLFRDGTRDREGTYDVYRKLKGPNGVTDEETKISFFEDWEDHYLGGFRDNQWKLLAPYFSLVSKDKKVIHYNLDDQSVLPFIEDSKANEPPAQHGGSADVRRVKIHPAHQSLCRIGDCAGNPAYAIKRLYSNDYNAFQHEVDGLKRFSGNNQHQHLINLLLTYHWKDQYHLLFHWADGNLLDYWKERYPRPDEPVRDFDFARWVCGQWLGVVDGLQAIHKYTSDPSLTSHQTQDPSNPRVHGRHGDLKPQNILWFERPRFGQDIAGHRGSFVISDFGLTMFHHKNTKSEVNPSNLARSPTYRPPEYDVRQRVSQKCDIWSLGCVMLEFLIWYLLGWKGIEDFQTQRIKEDNCEIPEDVFFNSVDKDCVRLKKSVAKIFESLREDPGTTQFFLDVLGLVEKKLLRMNPCERANCGEIVEKFKEINRRCQDQGYCTERVSKPQRAGTNLSELTATPLVPTFQEFSKPQRTGTNLSELMATPLSPSSQEVRKKLKIAPITEQASRILDIENSNHRNPNGYYSLHKARRVSTAPELRNSSYDTEHATTPASKKITEYIYAPKPMDMDEEGYANIKQDGEGSSSEELEVDGEKDELNMPGLKTKGFSDSGVDLTLDQTTGSALNSTQNKREMPKEDGEETMDAQSRKRIRY